MGLRNAKAWVKRTLSPCVRYATRQGARILMYHRFGQDGTARLLPVDLLDKHLRHLRRHYHVVPLRELVNRLKQGLDPEPYSVALTVDDAYADFGTLAYPVFRRHQVPVTLYVVSELASGRLWHWWDAVRFLVDLAPEGRYDLASRSLVVTLADRASRNDAWNRLANVGLTLAPDEIQPFLVELQGLLRVELPYPPPPEFRAMDWDSLRDLDPELVEIGAHTRTHPILAHCSTERVREEIAGSKTAIERELGRTVRTFGYPNGTPADVDERCFAAVRAAGYESAVLSRGALIRRGADLHALPRMSAFGTWDFFVGQVSGFSHLVPALIPARAG